MTALGTKLAARLREIEDARLQVVTLDRSRGVACARNHGMGIARGKFIAFLDDNNAWSPHKLETQLDVMRGDWRLTSHMRPPWC